MIMDYLLKVEACLFCWISKQHYWPIIHMNLRTVQEISRVELIHLFDQNPLHELHSCVQRYINSLGLNSVLLKAL